MLEDVVAVKPVGGYRLWLRFEDGAEGEADLASTLSFEGVFAPLRDSRYFEQVRVNSELGTIFWPNSADIDPAVLYSMLTSRPIPDYSAERDKVGR